MLKSTCLGFAIGLTVLFAILCRPVLLHAIGFPAFERMNIWAQSEFVAVMIDTTEKALRDDGRADFAAQMEQLFTTVEPGDSMSLGLVEYVRNEALARVDDAKHAADHPTDPRLEVEDALFVTLKKNGIVMSDKALDAVDRSMANFHAETYAEFEAKSPAEQRRFIALLIGLAWPDYVFRDDVHSQIESHKRGVFSDPEMKRNMLTLVNTQFPSQSTDQPGFANLAKEIEAGYTKSPDKDGPFFEITMYILKQLDAQVVKKIDAMDAHTLLLPGGRHIYKADNGDLWAVKKGSPDTKLDEHDTELANRISDCMTRRGISNGPEGLEACRDEVGIPRDDSTNPAPSTDPVAATPPPAAPPPAPASPPADDPIGGGGFITPPTNFKVMLCVPADVANDSSWNQPEAGSKMAAFKNLAASYIISIAKPSWEYWIAQGGYESFDPATTTSGDQIVSAVSPDSGRFDEFDPKCPSGYGAFWVQVNH